MNEIKTIGVVGAGAMGAGIVQVGLAAGLHVVLFDAAPRALNSAKSSILARLARSVEKGQLAAEILESADQRLLLSHSLARCWGFRSIGKTDMSCLREGLASVEGGDT